MIKFEMHLHNGGNSACASAPPEDIPKIYRDAGYGGIFVTNHYNVFAFDYLSGGAKLPWQALMDKYLRGYRSMRETGEKIGLKVLLAAELSPHRYLSPWGGDYPGMEFLIYGFDERFLYDNPNLHLLSQKELFEKIDGAGCLMYQSHPFRVYCVLCDPRFTHGVEAFNKLNARYNAEANQKAEEFALEHGLKTIAGTDFHHTRTAGEGLSGIYLPHSTAAPQDFVKYAKENKIKFI